MLLFFLSFGAIAPSGPRASSFTRFLDHTQRRSTVGRTPLDEWSARRRDLYLTRHNIHNRQTSMPPAEFEPTITEGERPHTYALDRAVTGTGHTVIYRIITDDRSRQCGSTAALSSREFCRPGGRTVHLSNASPSTSPDPIHSIFKIFLFLLWQNETEKIRPKNISGISHKNILQFIVKCLNTPKHDS